MPDPWSAAERDVIRRLQETLLAAVLRGDALPGSDRVVRLPDLDYVLGSSSTILSSENLAGDMSIDGLPRPMQVLSPEELRARSEGEGDVAYLGFRPPTRLVAGIRLTLEARISARGAERMPLGLSGIQVDFHQVDDRWEVAGEPAIFAI